MSEGAKEQVAHARIERAVTAARALLSGDAALLLPAFVEVENMVRLHFSNEEISVIPGYRLHDPEHASTIEEEHDAMREEMRACRQALEEGELERPRIEKLFNRYQMHQLHEDTTMYRWAREQKEHS
jgi:hypothetical protein